MPDDIDAAIRHAFASVEHLVRTLVRDELRRHLGPEADHVLNVKSAPMSARKLRDLIRRGELRGYRHGRDTFVSSREFQAFVEGRPVSRTASTVAEPPVDPDQDMRDEVLVTLGIVPTDPEERRAFDVRLARRCAEGGPRAAALARAEQERIDFDRKQRLREERAARRAAKRQGRTE